MEDEDLLLPAGASVATLRRHLGGDRHSLQLRADLFLALRREWEAAGGVERGGGFLRAVAACALHDQLLGFVLQLHAADALDIVEQLAASIGSGCFSAEEGGAATPAVTALAAAALTVALTLGVDREDLPRGDIERRVQAVMKATRQRGSALRSALVLLGTETTPRETDGWRAFEALPFELDGQLATTRGGRIRVQAISGLLYQQQRGLHAFLSAQSQEEQHAVAKKLWGIARDLLSWIEKQAPTIDTPGTNGTRVAVGEIDAGEAGEQAADFLTSEADLEAYLNSSSSSPESESGYSVASPEPAYPLEDNSSRVQKLLEAFSSHVEVYDALEAADLIGAAYDELAAVREFETVHVQVSYLLAWQLEAGRLFVDAAPLKAQGFERRLQRELNSLTENSAKAETQLRSLLCLSAFCPRRLIELVIHGAQTDCLHHSFYLRLLEACPLLISWEEPDARPAGQVSVFKSELQRMVKEVTSQARQFEEQGRHTVAFLSGLVAVSGCPQAEPVVRLSELLRDILVPLLAGCGRQSAGDSKPVRAFEFLQLLCSNIVIVHQDILPSVGSSGVQLFQLTSRAYASMPAATSLKSMRLREVLLLLTMDVLDLLASDASVTNEELSSALPQTLVDKLRSDAAFATLIRRTIPSIVGAFAEAPSMGSVGSLTVNQAKASAEAAMWSLLWVALKATRLTSHAPTSESALWRTLDNLATRTDILANDSPSDEEPMRGSSVIQSVAPAILLSCGELLGRSFRDNVVPFLMKYEKVDVAKRGVDTLMLPFPRGKNEHPVSARVECSLMSPHCVVRYLIKCWSLVALKFHRESPDLLFGMLRGVVGACDSAVSSSTASTAQLLACLHWECYLAFSTHELELDAKSWWPAVAAQLEMSLLRILHELARTDSLSPDQASVASGFTAEWLAMLPQDGSFAAVFRYLHANHERTRQLA